MNLRSIGGRLWGSFLLMVALVIAVGVVGLLNVSELNRASQMLGRQAQQVTRLRVIQAGVENTRLALNSALVNRSEGELARAGIILKSLDDQITAYEHSSASVPSAPSGVSAPAAGQSCGSHCHGAPSVAELETKREAFDKLAGTYLASAKQSAVNMPQATSSLEQASADVRTALDTLAKEEQSTMDLVQADAAAAQSRALLLTIIFGVVAAIAAGIMAFTITRSITRPLAYLVDVSDRISTGELDAVIQVNTKDEIAELGASLERMRVSLQAVIERLKSKPH